MYRIDLCGPWNGRESGGYKPSKSSKGYPEIRDPAAENPRGVLSETPGDATLRKLRQHYGPAMGGP